MTADIVNLRQQRKRREREERQIKAAENRVQFGRTKDDKQRTRLESERVVRSHDAHQMAEPAEAPKPGSPKPGPKDG